MENSQLSLFLSILSLLVALATMFIYLTQANEMKKQNFQLTKGNEANSYKTAVDILQSDATREARGIVLGNLRDKEYKDWTKAEIQAAEKVCQTYDSVAIMIRGGFLPVERIADSWGDSLRRTYSILSPLINDYRTKRNSNEYWDDFEWLASEANRFQI